MLRTDTTQLPTYIAIEGVIGVGKTTLTNALAEHYHGKTHLEKFEENPFLSDFYQDKARYAFQTELFFLLSRYQQQGIFAQRDLFSPMIVSDFLFVKSRLFASLTLSDHELAMYDRVYDILAPQIVEPDLVIYLTAPIDILMQRIAKRGRSYEQQMDPNYLSQLSRLYTQFFKHYDDRPVIRIETSELDFTSDGDDLNYIIDLIEQFWRGPEKRLGTA